VRTASSHAVRGARTATADPPDELILYLQRRSASLHGIIVWQIGDIVNFMLKFN
jgi:hypothetical protein